MRGIWLLLAPAVVAAGGCGGQFILSAADQVAPVGGRAGAVVRIQRTELAFLPLAVPGAAVRLQIGDAPPRAARTDKHGYAAAAVVAPNRQGVYTMLIRHQNIDGEEASAGVTAYVWAPDSKIVAVDLDCLPEAGKEAEDARAALRRVGGDGKVLYLTESDCMPSEQLHKLLEARGYPDGPILPWRHGGRFRKEASPLLRLKETFPNLGLGVCHSREAAGAFARAGMRCAIVGKVQAGSPNATVRSSWAELVAKGL
jgi:hypothetical protein